jgi:hypothetical protein
MAQGVLGPLIFEFYKGLLPKRLPWADLTLVLLNKEGEHLAGAAW